MLATLTVVFIGPFGEVMRWWKSAIVHELYGMMGRRTRVAGPGRPRRPLAIAVVRFIITLPRVSTAVGDSGARGPTVPCRRFVL